MKAPTLILSLSLTGCAVSGVSTRTRLEGPAMFAHQGPVCLIAGTPNVPFKVVGRMMASKNSYGEIEDVVKPLADEARHRGANAVIEYTASIHFRGPIVTKIATPVASGTGVVIEQPFSCEALGGKEA